MNTVLITGGAGFIGSTLTNHLSGTNQVIVIDDLSMGTQENLKKSKNLTFIHGSVTDKNLMSELMSTYQFDYIYHLAAIASVADSVKRPVATHEVNFESVLQLLELIRNFNPKLKRLVFASSAAVYGDEPSLPKTEESSIRPLTPYAIDKFAAEKYVLSYNELYGVPTSAVRFFNVYGPNQNPNSPYSGVISIIIETFKKKISGQEISFNVFGDGIQSRDFVYVEDVIQALLLVALSPKSYGKVYNVGTGNETSLNQLLNIVKNILNVDLKINYSKARSGDIPHSCASIQKLIDLGYKNNYTIEQGLSKYLEKVIQ